VASGAGLGLDGVLLKQIEPQSGGDRKSLGYQQDGTGQLIVPKINWWEPSRSRSETPSGPYEIPAPSSSTPLSVLFREDSAMILYMVGFNVGLTICF